MNYSFHDFTFTDCDNTYPVNDQVDLPAYSQNQQMHYTLSGWNDYDTFEPFFHLEMDELPMPILRTMTTYKWWFMAGMKRWADGILTIFSPIPSVLQRWVVDLE